MCRQIVFAMWFTESRGKKGCVHNRTVKSDIGRSQTKRKRTKKIWLSTIEKIGIALCALCTTHTCPIFPSNRSECDFFPLRRWYTDGAVAIVVDADCKITFIVESINSSKHWIRSSQVLSKIYVKKSKFHK